MKSTKAWAREVVADLKRDRLLKRTFYTLPPEQRGRGSENSTTTTEGDEVSVKMTKDEQIEMLTKGAVELEQALRSACETIDTILGYVSDDITNKLIQSLLRSYRGTLS